MMAGTEEKTMSQSKLAHRAVPPWALVTLAALAVILLGVFGWHTLTGYEAAPGPPKRVYPGMYDLRAAVAKRSARQGTGARQHAP
jgi:hypothetical protein